MNDLLFLVLTEALVLAVCYCLLSRQTTEFFEQRKRNRLLEKTNRAVAQNPKPTLE